MNITVALIDNQLLIRKALKELLESFRGVTVVYEADNGKLFLDSLSKKNPIPDICIMSSSGFMTTDIWVVREMKKKYATIKVMVVASHFHEFTIAKLLYEKIDGFLLKKAEPKELKKAVFAMHKKGKYWPESLLHGLSDIADTTYPEIRISNKYFQFLELCFEDLNYHEIAEKMGAPVRTIEGYRDYLFKKWNVKNKTSLVLFAIKNGIIELK